MDEQVLKELRNFDAVWSRVSAATRETGDGGQSPAMPPAGSRVPAGPPSADAPRRPFDEAETLAAFIGAARRDSRFYAALAERSGGLSGPLGRMAAENRAHARALQVEYFLLTGARCRPAGSCPALRGVLPALRLAHENEEREAAALAEASERTASERLRVLYGQLAADRKAHAAGLRALLARALEREDALPP